MNTEETYHIEFLESLKRYDPPLPDNFNEKIDKIINQIKCGKKYEAMWKEFKFKRGDTYAVLAQLSKGTIKDDMNGFEQKYFPVSRTRKEMIDELMNSIYNLNVTPRADKVDIIDSLIELRDKEEKE